MSDETKACKFCLHCKKSEGAYECRYNPPRPTGFPRVRHNDWCRCYTPDKKFIEKYAEKKAKEKERLEEARKAFERKG